MTKEAYKSISIFTVFFLLIFNSLSYASLKKAYNLFNESKYDESEKLCNEFLYAHKDSYQAYNLLGAINESKLNKKQEAINNYKNSISANPNQLEIYCKLVYLYNQLNDADNAIYYCCKGLEFYPDNYDLNYNLGILYLMQKNAPQKALEFLEHAKTHNPKNAKLIYLLGVIHIMTDDKITVLDNITELRKLNNPHLANKIEEMMRSLEYNKSNFNVTVVEEEIVDGAINNSEPGNGELPQIHVGDGKTSVNAAGEISIKTKFSKK